MSSLRSKALNSARANLRTHQTFWNFHPACLIGLSFLIGISISLFSLPLWVCVGWSIYVLILKRWLALFIIPLAALYAWLLFGQLPQLAEPKNVTGYFKISSIKINKTPFTTNYLYKGILYCEGSALPCSVIVPTSKREKASRDYQITGKLIQRDHYDYLLKPKKWKPIAGTWSLAEIRYQAKRSFKQFIRTKLPLPATATLLNSLATGEVEDRQMRYEFSRLGLQHILAISGFHFGVLIAFLALLLGFLPNKLMWICMLTLTTSYYLFIGDSPAIQRAWIVVSLFFLAKLIKRPTSSINLLGSALLIELIFNPLVAANLGFQFSFASCCGILLLYQPLHEKLTALLPDRSAENSWKLPFFSGLAYLLCKAFRSAISLTAAVNIALLPLLLTHFGKFPLLSLIYNLFIPLLTSLSLFLLLTALLISLLSETLANPLFKLLDHFTAQILDLISYPPLALDYSFYTQNLSVHWIFVYFSVLMCISIKINLNNKHYSY